MAVAALKHKPKLKTFHATMHVTRIEEWHVEAESPEQARDLLAAGAGHRCQIGECVNPKLNAWKSDFPRRYSRFPSRS